MLLVNSNSIVKLYAYGTNSHTIRVRSYHMRIRVWYVPYAYGMKYAYGTQHSQTLYSRMVGIPWYIPCVKVTNSLGYKIVATTGYGT